MYSLVKVFVGRAQVDARAPILDLNTFMRELCVCAAPAPGSPCTLQGLAISEIAHTKYSMIRTNQKRLGRNPHEY